jgi:FG-GAP-like repeat
MKRIFWFPVAIFFGVAWFCNCNSNGANKIARANIQEGERLSKIYCAGCHQYPGPELLDKATWANYVLPKMGELNGFRYLGFEHYVENGMPEIMKLNEWNKIVQYYSTQAPESVKGETLAVKKLLKQFSDEAPELGIKHSTTTMVNAVTSDKGFYFGDGLTGQAYIVDRNSAVSDSFKVQKGIVALRSTDTAFLILTMGVLQPSDAKEGKLLAVNKTGKILRIILDSLQRPVHANYADLNKDGREDIIVSEFGNLSGQLSWFENTIENNYVKHILRPLQGAIKTEVYDFNGDGLPDVIAMMAQGDEGVFIYYNRGKNMFKEERVLQLPPSYGSNYFEMVDFNKDGYPDIMATNGDNGDYPPVLKKYHGIRIYLNDGNNQFKKNLFLPVNGVGKAIAKDFDEDGDIDIASISFFPDYKNTPEEGFIYWENQGGLSFESLSFKNVTAGRWLTMDAGDIDGDEDIDIILGNAKFFIGAVPDSLKKKWDKDSSPVHILRNTLH